MKHLSVLFVLFLLLSGCASTIYGKKADDSLRSFQKVIDAPGQSKTELYLKANEWAVKNFVKANSVIEFSDKDAGKIMGKFVYEFQDGIYDTLIRSTVTVESKDGKVRISLEDPNSKILSSAFGSVLANDFAPVTTESALTQIRAKWDSIAGDFASYLNKKSEAF